MSRYIPLTAAMPLLSALVVFVVLPITGAWPGFAYVVGVLMLGIGLKPHIDLLSTEGHRIKLAVTIFGKRYGVSPCIKIKSEKWARISVTTALMVMMVVIVPLIAFVVQQQAQTMVTRVNGHQDVILSGIKQLLAFAREIAPSIVPEGDINAVLNSVGGQVFGDLKKVVLTVSGFVGKATGIAFYDWMKGFIAIIIMGVLWKEWPKEADHLRKTASDGITALAGETMSRRVLRYLELYQEALSILIIGYLEVAFALTAYYFIMLTVLPFNLDIGTVIMFAIPFGFVTAIWKIGGILTKVAAPILIIINFEPSIGWFGYEVVDLGLWLGLLAKALLIFAVCFYGGVIEAYDYTPEKIGAKLGLTKLEMVLTIVMFATGAGFFMMIWGVLALIGYQSFRRLAAEEKALTMNEDEATA